jgi:hypothetical protein
MIIYPSIKKTVTKLIQNENGSISKQNLIKLGLIIAASASIVKATTQYAGHGSANAHNSGAAAGTEHSSCAENKDIAYCNHDSHGNGWYDVWDTCLPQNMPSPSCTVHQNELTINQPLSDGTVTGSHNHSTTTVTAPTVEARATYCSDYEICHCTIYENEVWKGVEHCNT